MPVKSEAQRKFMGAVASGGLKVKGLLPSKALEFLKESKGKNLPKRK